MLALPLKVSYSIQNTMHKITWGKSEVLIASRWEELSRRDFLFFGGHFPIADTPEFHTTAFAHFMQAAKWGKDKAFWRAQSPETIYDILCIGGSGHLFAYLFEKPAMPKALWKRFIHHGKYYRGPGDELLDLSFGEFRYAEDCLASYLRTKKQDELDTFIAVIWRPGLRRKPFNLQKVDRVAKKLSSLPNQFKCALLMQYIAMRGYVIQCNKDAFGSTEPQEQQFAKETTTWGMLISALATNITEVQTIEHMPLWSALEWIANRNILKQKSNEPH